MSSDFVEAVDAFLPRFTDTGCLTVLCRLDDGTCASKVIIERSALDSGSDGDNDFGNSPKANARRR